MLIETIATGIGIIASVSSIIRNMSTPSCSYSPSYNPSALPANRGIISSVNNVEARIAELERQIQEYRSNSQNLSGIIANYRELIRTVQDNANYKDRLQFIPTNYGTWKLVKVKRKSKKSILRDPAGEYSDPRFH